MQPLTTIAQRAPAPVTPEKPGSPISVALLTTVSLGRSYLFYVERDQKPETLWRKLFEGFKGWSFDQLKRYDKPLGETAMFTFTPETHDDAKIVIDELQRACNNDLRAQLDSTCIRLTFFTTGVAILSVQLAPASLDDAFQFLDRIQDEAHLKQVRETLTKIISLCAKSYIRVIDKAEHDNRSVSQRGWSLKPFKDVDREDWNPKARHSYPLFFVTEDLYQKRTESILKQVASQNRRRRQSDRSRVSYQGAEIYVDWSEALVKNSGKNSSQLIANNFIIALASWLALELMNKNSSIFLFEAFVGMLDKKHRSNATAVHQRQMAYKDVSDASLPIRWTRYRRDLFLLETIHRNWSSERWRNNIEERMKLLSLHYKNLEDENNERANRRLAFGAVFISLMTLASAIADVINLADNDNQQSVWLFLGFPLKQIDMYLSLAPLIVAIPFAAWWFGLGAKIRRKLNR